MTTHDESHPPAGSIELPAATSWPMVLGLGVALLGAGAATNLVFSLVGAIIFAFGLAGWVAQLLPGRGHEHVPAAAERPREIVGVPGTVEQMEHGMPGHRLQLPVKVHPISAGVKGGIWGGLVMPVPALLYGWLSGHGIWFPINLLSGMVLPGIATMSVEQLEQFSMTFLIVGILIHATISVTIGLIYGVLLPSMPPLPGGPMISGGVLLPLIWTGASYGLMGVMNPMLQQHVEWFWFIVSQFVFGITAAYIVTRSEKIAVPPAGRARPPAQ